MVMNVASHILGYNQDCNKKNFIINFFINILLESNNYGLIMKIRIDLHNYLKIFAFKIKQVFVLAK
jgi:hypothetical protein